MDTEKRGSSNSTSFASTVLAFQFIAKSKRSVAQRWGFATELRKRWWSTLALQNLSKINFSSTELVPSGVEIFGMQFLRKNRFILAIIDLCWKDYCYYLLRTKNWTPFWASRLSFWLKILKRVQPYGQIWPNMHFWRIIGRAKYSQEGCPWKDVVKCSPDALVLGQ